MQSPRTRRRPAREPIVASLDRQLRQPVSSLARRRLTAAVHCLHRQAGVVAVELHHTKRAGPADPKLRIKERMARPVGKGVFVWL